jgi:hypothetical protein
LSCSVRKRLGEYSLGEKGAASGYHQDLSEEVVSWVRSLAVRIEEIYIYISIYMVELLRVTLRFLFIKSENVTCLSDIISRYLPIPS